MAGARIKRWLGPFSGASVRQGGSERARDETLLSPLPGCGYGPRTFPVVSACGGNHRLPSGIPAGMEEATLATPIAAPIAALWACHPSGATHAGVTRAFAGVTPRGP